MREFDLEAFLPRFWKALGETLVMTGVSFAAAAVIGILLALWLYASRPGNLLENRVVYAVLNFVINLVRPVPFLIVAIALVGVTRLVFGTGFGPLAATLPLTIVASVAIARVIETNLVAVDAGAVEAGAAMGASPVRVLFTIVIPESLGPMILGLTYIVVALVDATAVAGTLGGGGLGYLALNYGWARFDYTVIWIVVIALVVLVQGLQAIGNRIARSVMH
ncbi:methionine ABC transporter permease [Protaetiibacter intestinalis]|uniref:ABC transporter permease subunit n=1 Tax=Protaetiibacter intestinalis TaxID=2419774 RepID=A0A387BA84_9MICO|nr:ABC transporter permease subunit [Protaetiibacter intestinalis]AYF98046.1 ABC transporter permease subunit [Protaetiibacter intestinalis]